VATFSLSLFVQDAWCTKHCFGCGSEKTSASPGNEPQDTFFLVPQSVTLLTSIPPHTLTIMMVIMVMMLSMMMVVTVMSDHNYFI
jgi:hypothetical protein